MEQTEPHQRATGGRRADGQGRVEAGRCLIGDEAGGPLPGAGRVLRCLDRIGDLVEMPGGDLAPAIVEAKPEAGIGEVVEAGGKLSSPSRYRAPIPLTPPPYKRRNTSRFNELSPPAFRGRVGLAKMGDMLDAPPMTARVLVIEDDPNVAEVVARYLQREGYRVKTVADGRAGLATALAELPDLVILDLMLPSLGGLEICRQLRSVAPVAVIMLTARGEEADRIAGLELGADDYIAKPFSPRELTARVKAVLRRAAGPLTGGTPLELFQAGRGSDGKVGLEVDTVAHEVRVDDQLVALTAKEFDLLVHLMRNPRRALRREELLADVWGFSYGDTSTVTVHIRRLREKIEADPSAPRFVCTVWGVGYRFEP